MIWRLLVALTFESAASCKFSGAARQAAVRHHGFQVVCARRAAGVAATHDHLRPPALLFRTIRRTKTHGCQRAQNVGVMQAADVALCSIPALENALAANKIAGEHCCKCGESIT